MSSFWITFFSWATFLSFGNIPKCPLLSLWVTFSSWQLQKCPTNSLTHVTTRSEVLCFYRNIYRSSSIHDQKCRVDFGQLFSDIMQRFCSNFWSPCIHAFSLSQALSIFLVLSLSLWLYLSLHTLLGPILQNPMMLFQRQ